MKITERKAKTKIINYDGTEHLSIFKRILNKISDMKFHSYIAPKGAYMNNKTYLEAMINANEMSTLPPSFELSKINGINVIVNNNLMDGQVIFQSKIEKDRFDEISNILFKERTSIL